MSSLKILYIGSLSKECNSYMRFKTLEKMGHQMDGFDIDKPLFKTKLFPLNFRFSWSPGLVGFNRDVKKKITEKKWDVIWVDNKMYLYVSTLKFIRKNQPNATVINLLTDDPNGTYKNRWKLTRDTAKYFDWHFVQRPQNIGELKSWGAKNVDFCFRSYDPNFHRPLHLSQEENKKYAAQVGFIGSYEEERELFIVHLIQNGIPVAITGDGWTNAKYWNDVKPYYKGANVYGDEYIKSIVGMKICLHFLRKINRDEQDSRTFEIPACKGFMLAERSPLHEQFFKENDEAVFFDTKEELLEKVRYYLSNETLLNQIKENGYKRCTNSGYSHEQRLRKVIDTFTKGYSK